MNGFVGFGEAGATIFLQKTGVFEAQMIENKRDSPNGFGGGRFWLILLILLPLTSMGLVGFGGGGKVLGYYRAEDECGAD